MTRSISVLCIDDSALMRRLITAIVDAQPDMHMVATAPDPLVARELIKQHNPDVLTLDIEMPRMDGLAFLERLMRLRPMPVVMVSTLTERGSDATMRALALGAVDFVTKPTIDARAALAGCAPELADKIRAASRARVTAVRPSVAAVSVEALSMPRMAADRLFVVGASTGGTEAIRRFLEPLPADAPATLITQHMPAGFTSSFARRLDTLSQMRVKEAEHGEPVEGGCAYIAPGGVAHMTLQRAAGRHVIALEASEPVNRHRPSVDALFESVARVAGRRAVAMLFTGMGKDGARGLLSLRQAGAMTLAQDEASSVVYGMPREAVEIGAAMHVVSINAMAQTALNMLSTPRVAVPDH
jgi:two-component system chemotaxis response regulator CheB